MYWYLEVMRKYAVFTGRATRTEYWMFQLVNFVIVLLVTAVTTAGILMQPRTQRPGFWVPFFLAFGGYILATIIPGLAVSVRRLHDTDLSGWWLFISLVPLGGIVLFVFHVLDGTPGPNRYGPNPKGVVASSAGQYALMKRWPRLRRLPTQRQRSQPPGPSRVSAQNAEQGWFLEAGFACPAAKRQANALVLGAKPVSSQLKSLRYQPVDGERSQFARRGASTSPGTWQRCRSRCSLDRQPSAIPGSSS
jgi:uncharacterized membrane protein YhaH (DUF805 family)